MPPPRTHALLVPLLILLLAAAAPALPRADADDRDLPPPLVVEGYPGKIAYDPGENATLHVSTTATAFSVEIARIGARREVVLQRDGIPGAARPVPENASSHGCGWPASFEFTIPDDWRSGYYHVRLTARDSGGKFVGRNRRTAEADAYLVVRAAQPGKTSPILLQLATNTYNAYNNWGGSSLYAYHGRANLQGHRVSFQRPQASQFASWELPFVAWAENNGYVLEYAVNSDLEFKPEILDNYKLVLSVGHDEYWSAPMRDNLEAFAARGGNVCFLSGNTCCWQVRSEDDGAALVCWKQSYNLDPVFPSGNHALLTTLWSHHLVRRPENSLTGVGFLRGGYHRSHGQFMDGKASYTVHRPEHWVFEGTGLARNDEFGGKDTIVGYECDGCEIDWSAPDGLPVPTFKDGTPETFTILGTCPVRWHPDDALWYDRFPRDPDDPAKPALGHAVLGLYTTPGGGTVFTTGSTDWAHGLAGNDPAVVRITRNLLDKLAK